MKYIIGIGTNIGDRKKNIEDAVEALKLVAKTELLRVSSIYETDPVGYEKQDNFYNACAEIESALSPNEMLGACLGIEAAFGRIREFKNGPRILDLDVIFCESGGVNTENLTLPHPRFSERRFVLIPLLELFPSGEAYGEKFKDFLLGLKGQRVIEL